MQKDLNSGYYKNKMSNRAVAAYESGEKPISKWTKQDILYEIYRSGKLSSKKYTEVEKWTKDELVEAFLSLSGWHHTSSAFNRTNFYYVNEDHIKENVKRPSVEKTKKPEISTYYVHGEYKEVEFHPTSKSKWNKYKEYWVPFENGQIKGDWLILENGKRKKLSNVNILAKTKTKRRAKKHNL